VGVGAGESEGVGGPGAGANEAAGNKAVGTGNELNSGEEARG
jgi:hypothetical protein